MIYGKQRIIPSLVIFVLIILTPFWVQMGGASAPPDPELPKEGQCIEPADRFSRE